MFKAMVCALLEPQQEPDKQESRPPNDEEAPVQPNEKPRMDQQQISLPEADPAGFYTGSAFFAKAPTRVRMPLDFGFLSITSRRSLLRHEDK